MLGLHLVDEWLQIRPLGQNSRPDPLVLAHVMVVQDVEDPGAVLTDSSPPLGRLGLFGHHLEPVEVSTQCVVDDRVQFVVRVRHDLTSYGMLRVYLFDCYSQAIKRRHP